MERTSLYLVQSLPGISRWFEVDKREVVRTGAPCSQRLAGTVPDASRPHFSLRLPGSTQSEAGDV